MRTPLVLIPPTRLEVDRLLAPRRRHPASSVWQHLSRVRVFMAFQALPGRRSRRKPLSHRARTITVSSPLRHSTLLPQSRGQRLWRRGGRFEDSGSRTFQRGRRGRQAHAFDPSLLSVRRGQHQNLFQGGNSLTSAVQCHHAQCSHPLSNGDLGHIARAAAGDDQFSDFIRNRHRFNDRQG